MCANQLHLTPTLHPHDLQSTILSLQITVRASTNTILTSLQALVAACKLHTCRHSKNSCLPRPVHVYGLAVDLQRSPQCQIFVGLQHIHVGDMPQQPHLRFMPAVECQSAKHTEGLTHQNRLRGLL